MSASDPAPRDARESETAARGAESPRLQSARREMAFQSLLELGRELTVALDVYETTDLLLFNLMGQLGTARAALWLAPEPDGGADPVLVRAHGFRRTLVEATGTSCADALERRFLRDPSPILSWALSEDMGSEEFELVRLVGIAMFAPLQARGKPIGWLAVGPRLDGHPYSEDDVEVLRATLGMAAVSLQNAHRYNREKETTRRLRSANDHLQELARLKDEFLSNVNHELRTPLAVVIATLDAVVEDSEPRVRGLLEASLKQSLRLKDLIENLLSFSDASADRLTIDARPGDLNALLARVHAERLPGISAGLRELHLVPRPGLPLSTFDAQRVTQVLNELLDNAVKFTPSGTRIEMRADRFTEDGADWIGVEVADNGPGFPADRAEALFAPFQQGDGSSTRTAGGLGMGLARAKALVGRMGGRIAMLSRPGEGCRVRVQFPPA